MEGVGCELGLEAPGGGWRREARETGANGVRRGKEFY